MIAFENVTHHNYIGCQRVGQMLTHVNVKFADNLANVRKRFAIKQNRIRDTEKQLLVKVGKFWQNGVQHSVEKMIDFCESSERFYVSGSSSLYIDEGLYAVTEIKHAVGKTAAQDMTAGGNIPSRSFS